MIDLASQSAVNKTSSLVAESLDTTRSSRFTRYWLISRGLMLLWLMLSLWQVNVLPLAGSDEEAATVLAGFRLASAIDEPLAVGSLFLQEQMPLSYLPSAIGAHLLDVNEFTLRLPYALIGALQMPLLLALTLRLFGRRAAVFAGLMLLGTGLFAINRLAFGAGMFGVLELGGAWLLVRYVESGERRWIVLSSLVFAAAALTHPVGVVLLVAAPGIGWWKHGDRRDVGIALLTSAGLLVAFAAGSMVIESVYQGVAGGDVYVSDGDVFSRIASAFNPFGTSPAGFRDAWLLYLGIPVVSLTLIGLIEALVHNHPARTPVLAMLATAGTYSLVALVLGAGPEYIVAGSLLVIPVVAFGWAQLVSQMHSIATQVAVGAAVAAIALAGVVWNQAVFNPEIEFTSELRSLREYALSLDRGTGLFEEDFRGLDAMAHVIREETEADAVVFVREGVSAEAIELYSARRTERLDLNLFTSDQADLDGAFLVIKGEDESLNAGLSGLTTVVANHRVFADGESLYQLVQLSETGDPFDTPIWWRADVAGARLFTEQIRYTDFLPEAAKQAAN